jgi:ABC-type multidrug transport system fused ATPase/permease subunit
MKAAKGACEQQYFLTKRALVRSLGAPPTAFVIPYFAATTVQVAIRMNSFFTSLERLLEYEQLPQEREGGDEPPESEWPRGGAISFEAVEMRYRPGLPLALRGISFEIPAHSSVGVVGRTGAGKSSLIMALFRLVEVSSGCVRIDGSDISRMSLSVLRKRITILPQDPVLYSASVRVNLDPFGEYSEEQMANALKLAGLGGRVSLDDDVEEGGRNWSAGERQLLCFARACLRDNKIIVLDEPTSSIDATTDEIIQQRIVKAEFQLRRRCTILCIAHRLTTICDFDRILVMDKGQVREFDTPERLLATAGSEFASMVDALGKQSRRRIAGKIELTRRASSAVQQQQQRQHQQQQPQQ